MTIDIYFRLLALACGIGALSGALYVFFAEEGPFSDCGIIERFASGVISGALLFAPACGLIFTLLYGSIYAVYWAATGS